MSQQIGVSVALLILDLLVIAWLVFRYGVRGWADGKNRGNPPVAPKVAWQGMWILVGGALLTGGGLLALHWRVPGITQLAVLGAGAGALAYFGLRR